MEPAEPPGWDSSRSAACGRYGSEGKPNYAGPLILSVVAWVTFEIFWADYGGGVMGATVTGLIQGIGLCGAVWWGVPGRRDRNPKLHYWGRIVYYFPGVLFALWLIAHTVTGAETRTPARIVTVMALGAVMGVVPAFIAYRKGRDPVLWWMYGAALLIVALIHALVIQPRRSDRGAVDGANTFRFH